MVIMKLSSPLILNNDVQPACLPADNWAPENDNNLKQKCFTSGWGGVSVKRQNVFGQTAFWQNVIWQTAIWQ